MFTKLMPSRAGVSVAFKFPASMQTPLVTALLDAELERDGRATAVLVEGFTYTHESGDAVSVPCGYYTDFASIPIWLRWLIQPFGRHSRATVLHDWLYALGEPGKRGFADLTLLRAMKDLKVTWLQRSIIYRGVRMFGAGAYGHPDEYENSWANWRTGDPVKPKYKREEFYGPWPDDDGLSNCCGQPLSATILDKLEGAV